MAKIQEEEEGTFTNEAVPRFSGGEIEDERKEKKKINEVSFLELNLMGGSTFFFELEGSVLQVKGLGGRCFLLRHSLWVCVSGIARKRISQTGSKWPKIFGATFRCSSA